MKSMLLIFAFFIPLTSSYSQQQILGKWLSEDGEGITEIYLQGKLFYGKITWLKKPDDANGKPFTDTENPDKGKRAQPLLGLVILKGFIYKNNVWQEGTIYDPNTGKTYSCTIWISNGMLKVRGYWGVFYKTQTWTRVP